MTNPTKSGRPRLGEDELRGTTIGPRFTKDELAQIDKKRGGLARASYVRLAALDKLPKFVPEINREAWASLSKAASNLNQITRAMNRSAVMDGDISSSLDEAAQRIDQLKMALLGVEIESEDNQG